MEKKFKIDHNKLENLNRMAQIGWWNANFYSQSYICSDFVIELLGLKSDELPFKEVQQAIREDYKEKVVSAFKSIQDGHIYDQTFPILTPQGYVWIRSRLGQREMDEEGHLVTYGFIQKISAQDQVNNELALQEINNLIYQQKSISTSLLSFLKTEDTDTSINKILDNILQQFKGGRTYIFEYNWENRSQTCTYEVCSSNVSTQKEQLRNLPMDESPWWTSLLSNNKPIILSSLDELPTPASAEKELLRTQNIKSIMVIPMISKDKVWGYMGIDIVDRTVYWSDTDYYWFSSLANIVCICMELQKSEKQARQEREYFKNLYQHMPLGYCHIRQIRDASQQLIDYVYIDINSSFENITRRSKQECIGKSAGNIRDAFNIDEQAEQLLKENNPTNYLTHDHYIPELGKTVHSTIYSPEKDELIILFSDITDIIDMNAALDRNEKALRNIYKNIPVGIEIYNKEGKLIDLNDKDIEIFGLNSKNQALEVNLFENPNVPQDVIQQIKEEKEVNFILQYEFSNIANYYQSANSGVKDLIVRSTPLYNSKGELENFMMIIIDNTENLSAQSKIRDFENLFSTIAAFGKIGYYKWNPILQEGFAINQCLKNWGAPENSNLADIMGKFDFLAPEDSLEMQRLFKQLIEGKITSICKEVRVKDEENKWKWIRSNIALQEFDPAHKRVEVTGVNFDITELKETEFKLTEAKNKAEALDRLKSAFLANMSHEIRTPLNAIVGFSNLLTETEDVTERRQYTSIIQENTDLLLQLISDILDLSKIEAGTFEITYGEVDINLLCSEIIHSFKLKAPAEVELIYTNTLPECQMSSDRNRLMQIISNFINNALKFTKKGHIQLGYEIKENQIEFYVRDTGIGISEGNVKTIFDRFVKLNSFIHGTGLGLSICKSIVEQMGGEIGVESKEGEYSRFWFRLPYILPAQGSSRPNTPSRPTASGQKENVKPLILVVGETENDFILISTILKKEYTLLWAHNENEAVEMYKSHHPALILMDVKIPERGGQEATQAIRTIDGQVPIIALTAFTPGSDRLETQAGGYNGYLSKPVNSEALKNILKKTLE